MKYSRWPFMMAALVFCMLLATPMNADAALQSASSDQKHSGQKHTGAAPHAAQKSSGAAGSQHSRVEKSRKRNEPKVSSRGKSGKTEGRRSKSIKNSPKETRSPVKESADSRALWLKRAQESEIVTGKASWYGRNSHGGATASGVNYDMYTFTAAHRTLPMGTVVRVTDQQNGKSVIVCVTDRGPFVRGRIIDLSYAAAQQLDLGDRGVSKVELEVVSDEGGTPLKADEAFYVHYNAAKGDEKVGPYRAFADAAAMHEALRQVYPEAEVVMAQTSPN